MNEIKTKAIVIGSRDYKEKDKLVDLFSLENGVITVVFKGVKSATAKLKSAKEVFTFGDFILVDGVFKTVTAVDVVSNFYDITKNLKNYYIACNILTIIKTILPPGEVNSELFVDTLKSLFMLEENNIDGDLILSKYLIHVFEGFGYKFNLNACNNCGIKLLNHIYMNLNYGDITCAKCRVGEVEELSPACYSSLRLISSMPYEKLNSIKLPKPAQEEVVKVLKKNFYNRFGIKLS